MEFEYDEYKSQQNEKKHGINFSVAQRLWEFPHAVEAPIYSSDAEMRYLFISMLNGKHWSAIITYRQHVIRIISVRRSRKKEVSYYETYQ